MAGFPLLPHGVSDARPEFATICAMFEHAVATAPDQVAMRQRDAALTYGESGRAVTALARRLATMAAPGEVVALLLPNAIEFQIAYLAALQARMPPALLNPLYPRPQLQPLLADVQPRVILCTPATRAMVDELAAALGIAHVICVGADVTVPELVREAAAPAISAAGPDDLAAFLFSGGTTGLSKAVEYTHARLATATRYIEWAWPARSRGEVWLPIAPFTHIYGFLQGFLEPIFSRAEIVLPERFQPEHVVDLLSRHRVTVFGGGPPAIYAGVLAASNLATADLSALRVSPSGGAPVPVELARRWRAATGQDIHEGYGMTEMAPICAANDVTGLRPGSVGKALAGCSVQVVDLDSGTRVLPAEQRGEIRIKGPHMMAGYRNRPQETAQAIRDGYIYTGDIGHLDAEGFLFITDRKKDVVLVKGFNVFPREVEEVIYQHEEVGSVGVVGIADARTGGEKLVAFVVPRNDAALTADDIKRHCAEQLVIYKVPAEVRIVDHLPVTGAQKLDRMALRKLAAG